MKHYNPTIAFNLQRIFNLKSLDQVSELGETILPVVIVEPYAEFIDSGSGSGTGTTTLLTTAAGKDFYMTGASISVSQDVTSDSTFVQMLCTVNGVVKAIADLRSQSVTASSAHVEREFVLPIKIDRSTAITILSTKTVGTRTFSWTIQGYYQETTK